MLEMGEMGEDAPGGLIHIIWRWKKCLIPYKMTGNKTTQGMPGHHRFPLVIFKKKYPQASNDQCAIFIACHYHENAVLIGRETNKALVDMEMTRTRASSTTYQAFVPQNLRLHHRSWKYSLLLKLVGHLVRFCLM